MIVLMNCCVDVIEYTMMIKMIIKIKIIKKLLCKEINKMIKMPLANVI